MIESILVVLPSSDLERSAGFYAQFGFRIAARHEGYWLLRAELGPELHLRQAEALDPDRNPCGIYLLSKHVDDLATRLQQSLIHGPEDKPWGMYEFAVSDPDGALVRVGRPSLAHN